ncbi:MAG: ATP-dependent helicase [bacterium]
MNGNSSKYQEILNSHATNICVIAGPGSGKTKGVLVPKAKQIISDHGIDSEDVLIISFSRLSAHDLKERVKEIERAPRASTLHSICLSFLLSEDNHDIRKRIETIVIDFEKQIMLSDLKVVFAQIDKRGLNRMLDEFSAGWAVKAHDDVFNEDNTRKSFKAAVLNWLSEHEAAMMEEIVYNAVDLAKKISTNFIEKPQYIFVDEFQDLNRLEQEFINLLGANSKLVLTVGDPDQSIYSFKYAYPEGINALAQAEDVESHSLEYSGRCAKKILDVANQLLKQADPGRTELLKPLPDAIEGEVSLVQKNKQEDEFSFVLNDILEKVENGVDPKEIIVLVPRKKLGLDFVKYAEGQQLPDDLAFRFVVKNQYSEIEQEKILLLGIVANSDSVLRIRSYVGLKDSNNYAEEFVQLKQKYGNIREAIQKAKPGDFNGCKRRLRAVCLLLQDVREFIEQHKDNENLDEVINEIFPPEAEELADIRNVFIELREEGDTLQTLYSKFLDQSRTLKVREKVVRVMSLLASKGLDAEHVFIMGCNDGNIPGNNRSAHLTNHEHKQEQRRLLFVGVTRAKKSLTVSWSRNILFSQSRGHYTDSVRTVTIDGERYSQVGLSEFLQDINFD